MVCSRNILFPDAGIQSTGCRTGILHGRKRCLSGETKPKRRQRARGAENRMCRSLSTWAFISLLARTGRRGAGSESWQPGNQQLPRAGMLRQHLFHSLSRRILSKQCAHQRSQGLLSGRRTAAAAKKLAGRTWAAPPTARPVTRHPLGCCLYVCSWN